MEHVVVIGTGQGAYQLAASLRQQGYQGQITLVGDEPALPYQRPPLSKDYLSHGDTDRLALRRASFYDDQNITVRPSTRISAIDRTAMTIETESGEHISYDHLVLATGSRNRRPPIAGLDGPNVLALRTLADAADLRKRLEQMQRVTVIGGGFIGLEFSAVAAKRGIAVTVVEGAPRLMARAVSPATSAQFLTAHQSWGATVILGQFASRIEGADVTLADGTTIAGDTVIAAAGVVANDELAQDAGLATEDGVIVDAHLSTSDPDISALGDCCRFPEPMSGTLARLESVQAATDHARTIAARLLGQPAPYTAVPWFWSNQADLKLQIAGFAPTIDYWHTVAGPDGKLAVFGYIADALAVVETINQAGLHMAARKLLTNRGRITRTEVEAAGYDVKVLAARANSVKTESVLTDNLSRKQ